MRGIICTVVSKECAERNVTFVLLKNGELRPRVTEEHRPQQSNSVAAFNKRHFGQIRGLSVIEPK
jgi:hypothetical protein